MAWSLEYGVYNLEYLGLMDIILPFIIVFTIVFAALQKSKILGDDSKKFNVVIALVLGFSVIVPHVMGWYAPGTDVVDIMNTALPNVSLVAIAFVMVLMMLGILGKEVNLAGSSLAGWAVVISIIAVGIIFLSAANVFEQMPWWLYWLNDSFMREMIVVVLVFGVIIGFITGDPTKPKKGVSDVMKDFGRVLGGK